jgi:asparagine synthase (glutamine-hydrolysing)
VLDLVTDSRAAARGYLDEKPLKEHYQSLLHGGPEHHCFWWALTLEMWLRRYWD